MVPLILISFIWIQQQQRLRLRLQQQANLIYVLVYYTHTQEAMLYRVVAAVVIPIVMIKNIWMRAAKGSIQYPT